MEVEKFFGCYLLYSLNEKFKGRTYIGFTVDPNRRIKQHNRGLKAGGAWKTNNKGPWDMILIVHGFPTDVAALRFEWAWQNPLKSRRLRHVGKKIPRESALKYRFRVMSEMLRVGPWNRLPLTVQWLNISYKQDFDVSKLPPLHIPICVGPIVPQKAKNIKEETEVLSFCFLCHQIVTREKRFICFNKDCKEAFHVICLGKTFILSQPEKNKFLLPVDGNCPNCNAATLWGDVIRYVSGCYQEPQDVATIASPKVNSNMISVEKSKKSENEFHEVPESETDSKEPQAKFETKTDYECLLALNDVHLIQNVEQFECPVCFIDIDVGEGVILQECLHSFCRECLASTIQFSETVVVKCPFRNEEYTCESYLQEREVKSLVTPEVYEKHLQRSVTLAESQAQNSFHCKTPDCPGWCLFEDAVIVFLCPVCKHTNCITCAAIHEGKNCRQYQDDVAFYSDSREEARKTREHLQNMLDNGEAMRCPHCQIILIKNGGCDLLWCSMCRTNIRWVGKGSLHERMKALNSALNRFRTTSTSSSLFGFVSSLTQSTGKLPRGSTAFGPPHLTFGGFGSTNSSTGLSGRSRRTRTGLFGSTVPTAEIDLPLLGRVGNNVSPYLKYASSWDLPHNIIPSTSVASSEHTGLRDDLSTKDPIVLRNRNNANRKKRAAVIQRLQDISTPSDPNFTPELLIPATEIDLPLLSSDRVGNNVSPYVKYRSSRDLPRNIIPPTSVGSSEHTGLRHSPPTKNPIRLRFRGNTNHKKTQSVPHWLQDISPPLDINFSTRLSVPTTEIDLPLLSSDRVGNNVSPYVKYRSFRDLPRNIIPPTSVESSEHTGLRLGPPTRDPTRLRFRGNANHKKTQSMPHWLQDISPPLDINFSTRLSVPTTDTHLPLLSSGSVGSNISPNANYTSSRDLPRYRIPSTSVGLNEGIGLRDNLSTKDPIVLRSRNNASCKKTATVIQRLQDISAPSDPNFTPELLIPTADINLPLLSSGSIGSKISPYSKYTSSWDVPGIILPPTSVGSNENAGLRVGLPAKDLIEPRDRDNANRKIRATLSQRFQDISAPLDLNFTPELLSEPSFDESHSHYLAYDHFLEKSDTMERKSIQKRRLTKEETAATNKIENRATVKRRKKSYERRQMEEKITIRSKTRFDESHPYYVPNVASFNPLEKSATAYGKRMNRLGEIHLIKEETTVKGETRFDENNPYYVPNIASFNLPEKNDTADGKSTNRLGEIHLIKEEIAVKSEPSFVESHHDVPKLSDINSLEKSAIIRGKSIKSLEERPLIKIETIVKSEPDFDESHHDVPKLSDINSLEKSATICGKSIKSLEERPLIKIETIVKSEPDFDESHHDVPKLSDINSLEKSATIHEKSIKSLEERPLIKIETIVKSEPGFDENQAEPLLKN